ncbi:MAG: hypothetical protein FWH34_03425 [Desulfovibrionaceae bacterium]|nr:hypothetical protein [Desulfovibrionaceae bacterium]
MVAALYFFGILRHTAAMLPDAALFWLPFFFAGGVALQAVSLFCGRGWPARAALLCGGVLVCLYAAQERDITLAIGQTGILYVLWRMRFSAARPPQPPSG